VETLMCIFYIQIVLLRRWYVLFCSRSTNSFSTQYAVCAGWNDINI